MGILTFAKIREDAQDDVDKTPMACQLVEEGRHHLLSRPRRFGKSLFHDTLKECGGKDCLAGMRPAS